MRDDHPAAITAGQVLPITRPVYLVEFGFDPTPLRLSSREKISFAGPIDYETSILDIALQGANARISIWNHEFQYGALFLAAGPGIPVTVYHSYGNGPFVANDFAEYFTGITGHVEVTKEVLITCQRTGPVNSPRYTMTRAIFPYLPAEGTRIEARGGTFIITRKGA